MAIKIVFMYYVSLLINVCFSSRPNIIIIITDDQDIVLKGLTPMPKARSLIGDKGVIFSNAFASTPICCPSRSSILTGQYMHNTGVVNNSLEGGCSSSEWQRQKEPFTWPVQLHGSGYTTFYAGKYLNKYGHKSVGGTKHVPPGWDWWIGLVGNSKYYNYTLSVNGSKQCHTNDYFTDVIKSYSLEFLRQKHITEKSFLMVLATSAPHAPFIPSPKYKGHYKKLKVLKTPNFNIHVSQDKHWLLRMPPTPLPESMMPKLDAVYRHRWETLLSVDDLVEDVVNELQKNQLLENTYILFTSDHGYHIGQFGLPWDKRQPYEMDIRIPMMLRGPGISPKTTYFRPVLNIDLGPSFLTIAGLKVPDWMDGETFLPINNQVKELGRSFLIEYVGEGTTSTVSKDCHYAEDNNLYACNTDQECKCQDSRNNTYVCVRHIDPSITTDFLYCLFDDKEKFVESYNITADPYQLVNQAVTSDPKTERFYKRLISQLQGCSGLSCRLLEATKEKK